MEGLGGGLQYFYAPENEQSSTALFNYFIACNMIEDIKKSVKWISGKYKLYDIKIDSRKPKLLTDDLVTVVYLQYPQKALFLDRFISL